MVNREGERIRGRDIRHRRVAIARRYKVNVPQETLAGFMGGTCNRLAVSFIEQETITEDAWDQAWLALDEIERRLERGESVDGANP